MTTLLDRSVIELDPESFDAYARQHGWSSRTIELLLKPPLPKEPFMVADGTKPGRMVRIVEKK